MNPRRYECQDCGSRNIAKARCSVEDCDHLVLARDLCSAHYNKWWRRQPDEDDGFWAQVDRTTQERLALHSGQPQRSGGNL